MKLEDKVWRVIPVEQRDPAEIIAMEDVLQDFVGRRVSPMTFVLHHWQPSVSLAKPQAVSDLDLKKCREFGVRVVRTTGGGRAVYHDSRHDVSYSAVFPTNGEISPSKFYDLFCTKLARAVESLGLPVKMRNEYDFYVEGKKIGGNAQRLSRTSVMQHGTLLFDYSGFPLAERMISLMSGLYSLDDLELIRSTLTWVKEHNPDVTLGQVYDTLINSMTDDNYEIGSLTSEEREAIQSRIGEIGSYDWHDGKSSRGWCWVPRGEPKDTLYGEAVLG